MACLRMHVRCLGRRWTCMLANLMLEDQRGLEGKVGVCACSRDQCK